MTGLIPPWGWMVVQSPGDPLTQVVRHEIETNGARPVHCGPRCLAPAGLRTEQECVRDMLEGGQIESSDSPWASPVVLSCDPTITVLVRYTPIADIGVDRMRSGSNTYFQNF